MRRIAFIGIIGAAMAASAFVGCGRRREFDRSDKGDFNFDASVADGPVCGQQCSLDGRSVIDGCTGETVQVCADDEACGAAVCQEPCAAAAADPSSRGCEFYLQEPLYWKGYGQSCYAAFVVNTANRPVDFTLEKDGVELDISKAVFSTQPGSGELTPHEGSIDPGESVIVFVSDRGPGGPTIKVIDGSFVPCPEGAVAASYAWPGPEGTGVGSSFHLKSTLPIALMSIYPYGGAVSFLPTGMLHLPVSAWKKENIIVQAWESNYNANFPAWPGTQIVASDDTDITIVPTHDVADGLRHWGGIIGGPAHVPKTYHLAKGQYLQLAQEAPLTGSLVYSTKPVGIFGGHTAANTGACCADTLQQQIPAFEQWGNEYVGVGYRPRLGNEAELIGYRIVAARDGTRLDYDPELPAGAPTELKAGEFATFVAPTGHPFVVRTQDADHPIYLGAYMSSASGGGIFGHVENADGDPEFVNVIPVGQYMNSYSFFADSTYKETSLVVVRQKNNGKFDDVWLECAGNLTDFKPVGTRGEFEWTRVSLMHNYGPGDSFGSNTCTSGRQTMRSNGPFAATIWGWSPWSSYGYAGGMAMRTLVPNPLPPVVN